MWQSWLGILKCRLSNSISFISYDQLAVHVPYSYQPGVIITKTTWQFTQRPYRWPFVLRCIGTFERPDTTQWIMRNNRYTTLVGSCSVWFWDHKNNKKKTLAPVFVKICFHVRLRFQEEMQIWLVGHILKCNIKTKNCSIISHQVSLYLFIAYRSKRTTSPLLNMPSYNWSSLIMFMIK